MRLVRLQRVTANNLGEPVGPVRSGWPNRAHFEETNLCALARNLPGGLGAGEAPTDDSDDFSHEGSLQETQRHSAHMPQPTCLAAQSAP